ncbi:MAG: preprotein translocase subunit SecG [Acidobacteria bacterium]|nr:preprotein translocase subunit SecG [Acidobacteriota bacterium]
MGTFVLLLHIGACIILILVVLLQSGKAADLAGAFGGGGSQTAFGTRGAQTFLSKMTTGAAVLFMLTSLGLGILESREPTSIFEALPESTAVEDSAPTDPAVIPITPPDFQELDEEAPEPDPADSFPE